MITLRPYQLEAVAAAEACEENPLLVLATGLGKTTIFCELIRRHLQRAGGLSQALVIAHRKELLDQARERVGFQTGLRACRASSPRADLDVFVESVQTLDRRIKDGKPIVQPSIVIVDEAHHASAESYARVLSYFPNARIIGVTATPDRQDATDLPFRTVFEYGIERATRDGWLAPLRYKLFQVNRPNSCQIRVQAGDFVLTDLGVALDESNEMILEVIGREARGKRSIAFFPTVESAVWFSEAFTRLGFLSEVVTGKTPEEERHVSIERFRKGELDIICNCAVLTEGFDAPIADAIIMARPTKSESLYLQCVGRGTRLHPGKTHCDVLHFGFEFFNDFEINPKGLGVPSEFIELDPMLSAAQSAREAFEKSTGELLETANTFRACAAASPEQFDDSRLDRTAEGFARMIRLGPPGYSTPRMESAAFAICPGFMGLARPAFAKAILECDKQRRKDGWCSLRAAWFLWRWRLPPNLPRMRAEKIVNSIKQNRLNEYQRERIIAELRLIVGESERVAA